MKKEDHNPQFDSVTIANAALEMEMKVERIIELTAQLKEPIEILTKQIDHCEPMSMTERLLLDCIRHSPGVHKLHVYLLCVDNLKQHVLAIPQHSERSGDLAVASGAGGRPDYLRNEGALAEVPA